MKIRKGVKRHLSVVEESDLTMQVWNRIVEKMKKNPGYLRHVSNQLHKIECHECGYLNGFHDDNCSFNLINQLKK